MSASLRRNGRTGGQSTDRRPVRGTSSICAISTPATLRQMLDVAANYKRAGGVSSRPLAGKTLALIFEKPSTRTRVSFEVGMRQLGGDVIVLSARDMQIGRGETPGRHRARAVALCRCDHAAHRQRGEAARTGASTPRCR